MTSFNNIFERSIIIRYCEVVCSKILFFNMKDDLFIVHDLFAFSGNQLIQIVSSFKIVMSEMMTLRQIHIEDKYADHRRQQQRNWRQRQVKQAASASFAYLLLPYP